MWVDSAMAFYQSEKFFYLKEQFVIQSTEPHSMGFRSQHAHTIANIPQDVNRFLFIIFR